MSIATPQQALDVLNEIKRITQHVKLLPGFETITTSNLFKKIAIHENMLFVYNPSGQMSQHPPDEFVLAKVEWDDLQKDHITYVVCQGLDGQLELKYRNITNSNIPNGNKDNFLKSKSTTTNEALELINKLKNITAITSEPSIANIR